MEALLDFFDQTEPQQTSPKPASGQDPLPSSLPPEVLKLFVDTSGN